MLQLSLSLTFIFSESSSYRCVSGKQHIPKQFQPNQVSLSFNWLVESIYSYCSFRCLNVIIQSLSHVQLFVTPWITAHQASLSLTISQSLLKLTSIEWVMPSYHLIFCRPLLLLPSVFPSIRVFSSGRLFASGGRSIEVFASASVLPMNIQG